MKVSSIPETQIEPDIGHMDQSWFIDCVEQEWGWRAKQVLSLCIQPMIALLFMNRKASRLRYMGHGLFDCLLGRRGIDES